MGLLRRLEKLMLYATSYPGSADFVARRLTEIEREEAETLQSCGVVEGPIQSGGLSMARIWTVHITCRSCGGSGQVDCGGWKHNKACGCGGSGRETCNSCSGSGTESLSREYKDTVCDD